MGATRRWLLTAASLAAVPMTRADANADSDLRGRRLTEMLNHPESASRIAAAYLVGIGETDARRAALELDMPALLAPMDRIAGVTASRAWLGSRIRADFETGAVIDVDGWRLSRTEVGACLLVASVV